MRSSHAASIVRLDGHTKQDLRAGLVDRFQQDPAISVFLLSTKAGGAAPCPHALAARFHPALNTLEPSSLLPLFLHQVSASTSSPQAGWSS